MQDRKSVVDVREICRDLWVHVRNEAITVSIEKAECATDPDTRKDNRSPFCPEERTEILQGM